METDCELSHRCLIVWSWAAASRNAGVFVQLAAWLAARYRDTVHGRSVDASGPAGWTGREA